MSIAKMSLVELLSPRSRAEQMLSLIQDFGMLQLEEVPLVVSGVRGYLHRNQLTMEQEADQTRLREALRVLTELQPLFKGMPHPTDQQVEEFRASLPGEKPEQLMLRLSRLKRNMDSLLRKQNNITNDVETLESYRQRLSRLTEMRDSYHFSESMSYVAVLTGPADESKLENLQVLLGEDLMKHFQIIRSARDEHAGDVIGITLFAFPEEYREQVHRIIRRVNLAEFRLPSSARGLPLMKAVDFLSQRLADLPVKLKAVDEKIQELRENHYVMIHTVDLICSDNLSRLDCSARMAHSDMIHVLHGWMPSDEVATLRGQLTEQLGCEVVITELDTGREHSEQVPVRLHNAAIFRPFERLLKLFSDPQYGSLDPTPLMAIVFPLFFGLILGDAAYGLIIVGLAVFARYKFGRNAVIRDITSIAIWCGASSVLFGIVFGEFLGDIPHRLHWVPLKIGDVSIFPIWQERKFVINELLMLTVAIGFVHIVFGLCLGIYDAIRHKSRHHFGERAGLLIGLLGVTLFIMPHSVIPLEAKKGIAIAMIVIASCLLLYFSGPAGPVELISLVANVLSYSRMMALGIAGMVLAELANKLAAGQEYLVLGVAIAAPIHILALTLGILEPTIHALRLHFVEFLPKFFSGDGRPYTPLTKKGKYE
ncbi:hypothetical protein BVY04_02710 [bacterium M21]|nr:hypothetical protein BVY04_02710 [bacterium M21]